MPAARVNFFALEAYQGGLHLSAVKLRSTQNAALKSGDGLAALAFSSGPTTLSGMITCNPAGHQDIAQTWTVPLMAGWNLLWEEVGAPKDGVWQVSLTGMAVPKTAFWHLYEGYGGVGMALDATPDGHVVVYSVAPGGAADAAGVKVGDLVLTIDDHKVTESYQDAAMRVRGDAGVPVTLVVRRGDQTLTLKVVRRFIRG